jgi:hypothetical protein
VRPAGDRILERLQWAEGHLAALRQAVTTYKGSNPYARGSMSAVGVTEAWVALDSPVPFEIALRAGDVVHNLRASLDNLVWEVAPDRMRNDTRLARSIAFLIRRGQSEFDAVAGRLQKDGIPPKVMDAIRSCQVFVVATNGGLDPADATRLALLEDFWNDDKHRVPTAASGIAGGAIPGGTFTGSLNSFVRMMEMEVRFYPQRPSGYMTVDELHSTLVVIRETVLPRIRGAV